MRYNGNTIVYNICQKMQKRNMRFAVYRVYNCNEYVEQESWVRSKLKYC